MRCFVLAMSFSNPFYQDYEPFRLNHFDSLLRIGVAFIVASLISNCADSCFDNVLGGMALQPS